MIHLNFRRRRQARNVACVGVIGSAVMLMISVAAVLGVGPSAAQALDSSGSVTLTPVAGGAPTDIAGSADFLMAPPSGAVCPGTGAAGYRFFAFIVADTVDTSTMAYNAGGPIVAGGAFAAPQYTTAGDGVLNLLPAVQPVGFIDGIPAVSYAVYSPGAIAAGQYKVGISCTLNNQTVSFWQSIIKVEADGSDPSGIKWSLDTSAPAPTTVVTTTTVAPTTTLQPTTTTHVGTTTTVASTSTTTGSTTTTAPAGTTTTVVTTTTVPSGTTSTTRVASQAPVTSTTIAATGRLANTGSSPLPIVIWAVLLLVFGRVVILLARPVRVRPPGH
ncbi:MAG: hypothetical protein JWM34_1110 [Ilumatobacteraceae bacterium]|nr:hypothetical protein [Ilumatobacteraceae bacterium]